MKLTCLMFLCLVPSGLVWAGEIVLFGEYQGKNVFVQNPYHRSASTFCTTSVFVNDRLVLDSPKVSAFKIDLSYLKIKDLVVIRIEHLEGCRPTIINPQVLQPVEDFRFLGTEVDNNSIRWITAGEREEGIFEVEKRVGEEGWQVIHKTKTKRGLRDNLYAVSATHTKGQNQYRVKYEGESGSLLYSLEVYYTHTDSLITFQPQIVTSQITLSDSTGYQIVDFLGKVIKKGQGREILLLELKPGEYYLEIQDRREKFIKR